VLLIAGSLAVLILAIVIVATSDATRRPADHRARPKVSADPLHGLHLYLDPQNRAALQIAAWQATGDTADATLLQRIATQPTAYWLAAGSNPTPRVAGLMQRAAGTRSVAELVLYFIPGRDCQSYSSGGAPSGADYLSWVRAVAAGIGGHPAIVILEPDAIDQAAAGCYSQQDAGARYQLLANAVTILKGNAAAHVYLDAGNAGWLHPRQIAGPLRSAGIARADGFALNVANFETTASSVAYGRRLSGLVGGRHFIVDTSRNGNGPPATHGGIGRWCNPSGRALGAAPTTDTGNSLVDALLWIKYPGTSDGECRAGAPPAGAWWPAYAVSLVRGTGG
jgi:endoglucanase